MNILGISCYYHDSAAALLQDGLLVAAAEEERFTRKKHDFGFPDQAIDFCLQQAGIRAQDLDYVVFYEKPLLKFERILLSTLQTFPQSWGVFRESMIAWFNDKLWVKGRILTKLDIPDEKLLFVEHHLSHAQRDQSHSEKRYWHCYSRQSKECVRDAEDQGDCRNNSQYLAAPFWPNIIEHQNESQQREDQQ